jgi:uncharacterized protein (TIGR02677 family)
VEDNESTSAPDAAPGPDSDRSANLSLYRYLAADEVSDYLAIMRVATGTLLADLSGADVAAAVTAAGHPMDSDTAETRCRQLVAWHNLVRSVRDTRVTSIAAYQRSRSRYQVSKLGGHVQRDVQQVLDSADGAREVAREMLGRISDSLDRILVVAGSLGRLSNDPDDLAGHVTGVFTDQRLFTESVTDFYAYLSGVLTRYDLAGDEYARFKDLLLAYVEMISADVARNAPAILTRLTTLLPLIDDVIAALPAGLGDTQLIVVERLPGRTRSEWEQLAAWYGAADTTSGPEQLRSAAGQALRQLLANARRILTPSGTGVTRRADFLKLAGWFHTADNDTAHRLYDAAFGAWPSRHLALGPDYETPRARPTDSWWDSDPVEVPVTMREHGDRTTRGRASRVPDMAAEARYLVEQAQQAALRRRQAAVELAAVGDLDGSRVSPLARDLLLKQLNDLFTPTYLLGDGPAEITDTDLEITVTAIPAAETATVVHSSDGVLTVAGYRLTARPAATAAGAETAVTA